LSKTNGNTFYHAGELIAQLSAINLMKAPPPDANDNRSDAARAFDALCIEINSVSRNFTELFGQLIAMLGENAVEETIAQQIPNGPKISTFSLPYFFDEVDALPVPPRAKADRDPGGGQS
jgi:hypothetical protein